MVYYNIFSGFSELIAHDQGGSWELYLSWSKLSLPYFYYPLKLQVIQLDFCWSHLVKTIFLIISIKANKFWSQKDLFLHTITFG